MIIALRFPTSYVSLRIATALEEAEDLRGESKQTNKKQGCIKQFYDQQKIANVHCSIVILRCGLSPLESGRRRIQPQSVAHRLNEGASVCVVVNGFW